MVFAGIQVAAAALAFPLFTVAPGLGATALLAAGFGAANSLARPTWMWLITRVPQHKRGATMGFTATSNQIGLMVGSAAGGMLVGSGNYAPLGLLAAGSAVLAGAVCLIGSTMKR